MTCCNCGKPPEEINEYLAAGKENDMTPKDYVREEEGTWNPETGHFCCTACYIKIGMPATTEGWKAP